MSAMAAQYAPVPKKHPPRPSPFDRRAGAEVGGEVLRDLRLACDAALVLEAAGIEPDGWQADVLRSNAAQILLNVHRQGGKSTAAGALAVHQCVYTPGSLVLVISPSLRQSGELFRTCMALYNRLGVPVFPSAQTRLTLELENGSRLIALPGKEATIRGYASVDLLIFDEAARTQDALYQATRPMLALSGGRLLALSTPFGARGWWHHEWAHGGADWLRVKVTADQCPRLSPEWLASERRRIGDWWFRQEYLGVFVEPVSALFTAEDIAEMFSDDELAPLFARPVRNEAPSFPFEVEIRPTSVGDGSERETERVKSRGRGWVGTQKLLTVEQIEAISREYHEQRRRNQMLQAG